MAQMRGTCWLALPLSCLIALAYAAQQTPWLFKYEGAAQNRPSAIAVLPDGGLALATSLRGITRGRDATLNSAWLLRLEREGIERWQLKLDGKSDDEFHGVAVLPDQSLIAAGTTGSGSAGKLDGWLVNVDEHGKERWRRTFHSGKSSSRYLMAV